MSTPKKRRKEQRPEEILNAALEEFIARGYAGTRLDDVARRAGISKGLVYVYFDTKEELFKAVIRTSLVTHVEMLRGEVASSQLSSEELLRGPVLGLMKQAISSRIRELIRLLIAEGPKHPDLTAFYYQEVVSRGMAIVQAIIDRGIARGEFRATQLREFPQLVIAPMLMMVVWKLLMERHRPLDADKVLETHIELLLQFLKSGKTPALRRVPGERRS